MRHMARRLMAMAVICCAMMIHACGKTGGASDTGAAAAGPASREAVVDTFDAGLKGWSLNKAPNISIDYRVDDTTTHDGHKSLKATYTFTRDRKSFWGFLDKDLGSRRDWSQFDALRFSCLVPRVARDLTDLSVMLYEDDGSAYVCQQVRSLKTAGWEEVTVAFSGFHIAGEWTKDENGKLDLDQVRKVSIGIWQASSFSDSSFEMYLNSIRAVKVAQSPAAPAKVDTTGFEYKLQKFEPADGHTCLGVYAFSAPMKDWGTNRKDWEKQWDPAQISEFSRVGGRDAALVGFFWFLDWEFPSGFCSNIGGIGKTPVVGVLVGGYSLSDISSGKADARLTAWASGAKAFGKPMFVRFLPEMNGNWHIYSEAKDPAQTHQNYVKAWRHAVEVFRRQGADNVAWLWSPTSIDVGKVHWTDYYPGDDVVDWVGISVYSFLGNGDPEPQIMGVYSDYAARKPIMIAECAAGDADNNPRRYAPGKSYYDNPEMWIGRFFDVIEQKAPRVKAIVWFNIDRERVWKIQESPQKTEVFRKRITNGRYDGRLQ
jgi:hypothetical protein